MQLNVFLERLSVSPFSGNFVVKGGFLISALTDMGQRTTMDLDATCIHCPFDQNEISRIMSEICSFPGNDDFSFRFISCEAIRERSDYPGLRVHLTATYETLKIPFSIDVTFGDVITPKAVRFTYPRIFDDGVINLMAYTLETVLAEKLESILRLNIINTRMRDFYDICLLSSTQEIDTERLSVALKRTCNRRGDAELIAKSDELLNAIEKSERMQKLWEFYRKQYPYAKDITWQTAFLRTKTLLDKVL